MRSVAMFMYAALASASLAACESALSPEEVQQSLKAATAVAVTGADANAIEVIAPERSAAKWTWTAKANGAVYKCDADNQMRLPSCAIES